jgi:hypothetical protein
MKSYDLETVTAEQHFKDTGVQFPEGFSVVRFKHKRHLAAGAQDEAKVKALQQALMEAVQEMLMLADDFKAHRRHHVN